MKSTFDKKLSAKFEDISPEDIGVKPNRERLWQSIEQKQQRKTINLRLWISHAAAIAIGLLAGIYLLKDSDNTVYTAVKKSNPTIHTDIPIATPKSHETAIAKRSKTEVGAETNYPYTHHKKPIKEDTPKEIIIPDQEDRTPIPEPEELIHDNIAAIKPMHYRKVMHLADMTNENNHLAERNRYKPETFWTSITPNRFSANDNYETISSIIVNHIK